jgi:hypothetical protein
MKCFRNSKREWKLRKTTLSSAVRIPGIIDAGVVVRSLFVELLQNIKGCWPSDEQALAGTGDMELGPKQFCHRLESWNLPVF